ncbi:MAG TPA: response regulator [Bacteroidia bacterium]|jgi:DNA-binding NarL/FixJ family response regulator|nr:response regulator [Bacteroidia bacterium]
MKNSDQSLSVFLVDDDALFLTALKHRLREKFKSGIRISTFLNGESCLQHMIDKPDIVFLDYYLHPESSDYMNGLEVLKKIKRISDQTEVVMLSSVDKKEIISDSLNSGAYKYITKGETTGKHVHAAVKEIIHDSLAERNARENRKLNYIMAGVILLLGSIIAFAYLRYFAD